MNLRDLRNPPPNLGPGISPYPIAFKYLNLLKNPFFHFFVPCDEPSWPVTTPRLRVDINDYQGPDAHPDKERENHLKGSSEVS